MAARKSSNGSERQGRRSVVGLPSRTAQEARCSWEHSGSGDLGCHRASGLVSQPNLASHSRLTLISKLEQPQLQFGLVPGFLPRKRSESICIRKFLLSRLVREGRSAATLFPGDRTCRKTPGPSLPSDDSPLLFTQAGAFPPCLNRATQRFRGEQSVPRHGA